MQNKIGLALSNLANFDQGSIDMQQATNSLQAFKSERQDRTIRGQRGARAREYVANTAPDQLHGLDAGEYISAVMNDVQNLQTKRAAQEKEPKSLAFNVQFLPQDIDGVLMLPVLLRVSNLDQFALPISGAISQRVRAYTLMVMVMDQQQVLGLATGRLILRTNPLPGEPSIVEMAEGSMSQVGGQEPVLPTAPNWNRNDQEYTILRLRQQRIEGLNASRTFKPCVVCRSAFSSSKTCSRPYPSTIVRRMVSRWFTK